MQQFGRVKTLYKRIKNLFKQLDVVPFRCKKVQILYND